MGKGEGRGVCIEPSALFVSDLEENMKEILSHCIISDSFE